MARCYICDEVDDKPHTGEPCDKCMGVIRDAIDEDTEIEVVLDDGSVLVLDPLSLVTDEL